MGKTKTTEETVSVNVTLQEKKVLDLMRGIDFGEFRVIINHSEPVRVEEIKKSVQL